MLVEVQIEEIIIKMILLKPINLILAKWIELEWQILFLLFVPLLISMEDLLEKYKYLMTIAWLIYQEIYMVK